MSDDHVKPKDMTASIHYRYFTCPRCQQRKLAAAHRKEICFECYPNEWWAQFDEEDL